MLGCTYQGEELVLLRSLLVILLPLELFDDLEDLMQLLEGLLIKFT